MRWPLFLKFRIPHGQIFPNIAGDFGINNWVLHSSEFPQVNPPLILGLNPAWQRLFCTKRVVPGGVHRLTLKREFASGKGINVARVMAKLGTTATLAQMYGGTTGNQLIQDLRETLPHLLQHPINSPTRICTTISDDFGISTELIEESPQVSVQECQDFVQMLQMHWHIFNQVVLCGSAPARFEYSCLDLLSLQGKRLYVDAIQVPNSWIQHGIHLLKINGEELRKWLQKSPEEIFSPAWGHHACQQFNIRTLVVTHGTKATWVFQGNRDQSIIPLTPQSVVNTIGAGDAFLAAWIVAENRGDSLEESLHFASTIANLRIQVELPWEFTWPQ